MSEFENDTHEDTNKAAKVAAFAAIIAMVGVGGAKAKGFVSRKRAERKARKETDLKVVE